MPRRRLKLLFVWFGLGLATTFAVVGCGPSPEEQAAAERAQKAARKADKRADLLAAEAVNCQRQLGDFLNGLKALNSRLGVGLNYENYSEEVATLNVTYDNVPFGQLGPGCIAEVGIQSEKSLNRYLDAYNTWNECFEDLSCDSVEPQLQAYWTKADSFLRQSRSGLRSLRAQAVSADDAARVAKNKAKELSEDL